MCKVGKLSYVAGAEIPKRYLHTYFYPMFKSQILPRIRHRRFKVRRPNGLLVLHVKPRDDLLGLLHPLLACPNDDTVPPLIRGDSDIAVVAVETRDQHQEHLQSTNGFNRVRVLEANDGQI